MFKISVIGTGYVGLTTGIGLANFGSSVLCLDIDEAKIHQLNQGLSPIYEPGMDGLLKENVTAGRLRFSTDLTQGVQWADIIFIAVGTPQAEDGQADLSAVEATAALIGAHLNGYKIIITKSTVPVGSNEKIRAIIDDCNERGHPFDVVSNPEFLREGRAVYDFLHPDRVVIGVDNHRPVDTLKQIYRPLYLNEVPFIVTDLRTAELIKYASNSFLAMKVAFINEMSRLCDVIGADVQQLAIAVGKDGRIGGKFLHPGPGFGGSCFPKDTAALMAFAREKGMPLGLVEETIASNRRQKEFIVTKIKQRMGAVTGLRFAVLGLAFKSETDDMRESAAITIIDQLLDEGAIIRAYDPQAMKNAKKLWDTDQVYFGRDEYDTIEQADAVVILTEWNQFRNLDIPRIKSAMRQPFFFDFRNIYQRKQMEDYGLVYECIGR
ncbi:nucleotide sugar dehydrogenase [Heliobacterium gestii]|uniref:UDP-glucose 6-dehydrogenase n=1 Tax=Heliomicrobium gestii TaxID=2699 RepID=A0A845LIR3_HELGE|nr:UDP-glucose/GDP-mannose dehydrogenase family protein [Heliomicrobium gestii]MBM7868266.1 UDPglucose 6-dehydrogenase [Heliomicrobium gestii]MZP44459.1 nucleotide sugar dehydrogenase [Heliomicrobium gestii]